MSTTERKTVRAGRPLLLAAALASVGGLVALYLAAPAFRNDPNIAKHTVQDVLDTARSSTSRAPVSASAQTGAALTPASAPLRASAPSPGTIPRPGATQVGVLETEIPPHQDRPGDVVVEIGPQMDADDPSYQLAALPGPVTTLGPPLNAEDPTSTVENSSTEVISIGDEMSIDEPPH